jgi:hypothetical protein
MFDGNYIELCPLFHGSYIELCPLFHGNERKITLVNLCNVKIKYASGLLQVSVKIIIYKYYLIYNNLHSEHTYIKNFVFSLISLY